MFVCALHTIAVSEVTQMRRKCERCVGWVNCTALAGTLLVAVGIILLFVCIPAWAWAALGGVALMTAGCVLLRLCNAWR